MSSSSVSAGTLKFGDFEADLRARELRRQGAKVRLPDQSFQVLVLLLEHRAELVTRDEIRKKLWPEDTFVDFDHGLNNAVNRLREALGDSADSPGFIETLPRRGYRFIGTVTASQKSAIALSVDAGPSPQPPSPTPDRTALRRRSFWWIAVAATVLGILLVASLNLRRYPSQTISPQPIQSLAVLPFGNLSVDPSQEYFADGVTDTLITDLAQIGSLRVISRTSAMHYKGSHQALPEIARELNVDAIVEGSVARMGKRIRITAQLIQARSDRHLWARSYEGEVSDILQLQSQLATAVAREVAGKLSPQEQSRLDQVLPVDSEAYEDYLRGRYFWNLRTEKDLKTSQQYFERAIHKDPSYAQAYAGLADFYNLATFSEFGWLDPKVAAPKAIAAAKKALELDGNLAEAHAALGLTKARYASDFAGAETEFQRALQLNPGYANTYIWYAFVLGVTGRTEQACSENGIARQLDPLNPTYIRNVAGCLYDASKHEEGIREMSLAIELAPSREDTRYSLAAFYEKEGRFAEAIPQYEELVKISSGGDCERSTLSYALAASGRRAEAEKLLNEIKSHPKYPDYSYCLASAFAGLGRNDEALQALEETFRKEGPGAMGLMTSEYRFAGLRSDPRFQDLVRRAGLGQTKSQP